LDQVLFPDQKGLAGQAVVVGGLTVADIVYHAAAIEPEVLRGADFSRSEDLSTNPRNSRQIVLLSSAGGEEFDPGRRYGGWRLLNIRDAEESTQKSLEDGEEVTTVSGDSSPKTLRYSDVYDFQGLESELAILVLPVTDRQTVVAGGVTLPREKHLRRVLYTGMTRAKTMLVIVAHETYRETLELRQMTFQKLKPVRD